jgi:putative ABC transport system ATP-binding protein
VLALVATAGRVVVPVAVQQTPRQRPRRPAEPDLGLVRTAVGLAAVALVVTAYANYRMNVRLYRTTENGLSALRTRAFRRVHDLSVLHQAAERRGSLGLPRHGRRRHRQHLHAVGGCWSSSRRRSSPWRPC